MCVPVNSFIAATKFLPPKKYRICSVCQNQNDNPSYIFEGWEISRALYKISPKIYVVWYNSKFTASNSHHVTWKWSILWVTIPGIVRSQWQRHVHPRVYFTHRIPIQRQQVQIRRRKASTHQPKRNPTNWRHTRLPERKMIIVKITYRKGMTGSEVKWQLTWVTHVMPKRKRATQTPNTTNSRRSFFGNFSIIAEAITSTCPN